MITTKWPRLLVVGEPVTPEQADHILIRTSMVLPYTNDKGWEATVQRVFADFGCPPEPPYSAGVDALIAYYQKLDEWQKRAGFLDLGYLHNDRISSAWIGGPHGWCNWDGTIGCSSHNIGKWPSTGEVTEDWQAISAAFPFLDLTAQLLENEGEGPLCGQWRVHNGTVEYDGDPVEQICPATEPDFTGRFAFGGERGVTEARLRQALERVVSAAGGAA